MKGTAAKSLQLCLTLSDPMDCSLPGSSIHGIFQARVLEWGAIAFSEWKALLPLILQRQNLLVLDLSLTEGKQFEYVTTVYLNVNFMQFMMTNAMQYFMIYKPCFRIHLRFPSDSRYLFLC